VLGIVPIPVAEGTGVMSGLDGGGARALDPNLYPRLLNNAVAKLGSEHALASYLGLSPRLIHIWIEGRGKPPDSVFLRVVDLLEAQDEGEMGGTAAASR